MKLLCTECNEEQDIYVSPLYCEDCGAELLDVEAELNFIKDLKSANKKQMDASYEDLYHELYQKSEFEVCRLKDEIAKLKAALRVEDFKIKCNVDFKIQPTSDMLEAKENK